MKIHLKIVALISLLLAGSQAWAQSITLERLTHFLQTDAATVSPKPTPFSLEIHIRHGSTDISGWGPAFYKPGSGGVPATSASSATNTGILNFSATPNNGQDFEFIHGFPSLSALNSFYPIAPTDGGQYGILFQGPDAPTPDEFTAALAFNSDVTFTTGTPKVTAVNNGAVWSHGVLRVKRTGTTTISLSSFPEYGSAPYGTYIAAGIYKTNGSTPVPGAAAESFHIPSTGVNQTAATAVNVNGALLTPGENYTLEIQYGVFGTHPEEGFPDGVNFQGLSSYYKVTTATVRVIPPTIQADFNADGQADMVWRNHSSNKLAVWLMNGTSIGSTPVLATPVSEWQVKGVGDFNADGKTDLLWRQSANGNIGIWLMDGTTPTAMLSLGSAPLYFEIAGTGDFNADGETDILWRNNSNGNVGVWLMDGTTPAEMLSLGPVPLNFVIAGTGDFNADGETDILWRNNSNGSVGLWLMDGTTPASMLSLGSVALDWRIDAADDYNGDGSTDIVWRQTSTGKIRAWMMNGTVKQSEVDMGTGVQEWQITQ